MLSEIIQIVIALPVVAALLLLVPRRAARAWAVWLLICLIAVSLHGIGQGVLNHYNPHKLYLFTSHDELDFLRDQSGELAGVVINDPPEGFPASRIREQPVIVAGRSLLLACAILLLLLRAEPGAPSTAKAAQSSARGTGISLQAFGLVVLVASIAEAIISRSGAPNLAGVAVIASGFYVSRGSRVAAQWALILMVLIGFGMFLLVTLVASGENVNVMGGTLQPGQAPWAITIGLAVTAWAAVNLFLTIRFLSRPDDAERCERNEDNAMNVTPPDEDTCPAQRRPGCLPE
ncbi:MAG: hypothetical protein RBS80_05010 [Thermoguttaceae bacterium]|jgi:hypothetical protein|nr:hypothetical protein [Thermoguttaceae bacterium]